MAYFVKPKNAGNLPPAVLNRIKADVKLAPRLTQAQKDDLAVLLRPVSGNVGNVGDKGGSDKGGRE